MQMQMHAIIKFSEEVPKKERIAAVAPIINALIEQFENQTLKDGVETFQEQLMERIRAAHLSEMEWIKCECICVHPDNREKSMLVPIDAHSLLLRVTIDGWAWTKCIVVAARIPKGPVGDYWVEKIWSW